MPLFRLFAAGLCVTLAAAASAQDSPRTQWDFDKWLDLEGWTAPACYNPTVSGGTLWLALSPETDGFQSWRCLVYGAIRNLKLPAGDDARLSLTITQTGPGKAHIAIQSNGLPEGFTLMAGLSCKAGERIVCLEGGESRPAEPHQVFPGICCAYFPATADMKIVFE